MFITSYSHLPNLNLSIRADDPSWRLTATILSPTARDPSLAAGLPGTTAAAYTPFSRLMPLSVNHRCPQLTLPRSHGPWLSHRIFRRCSYHAPVHPSIHPGQTTQELRVMCSGEYLRQAGPKTQRPHVGRAHRLHSSSISTSAPGMKCTRKHKEGT